MAQLSMPIWSNRIISVVHVDAIEMRSAGMGTRKGYLIAAQFTCDATRSWLSSHWKAEIQAVCVCCKEEPIAPTPSSTSLSPSALLNFRALPRLCSSLRLVSFWEPRRRPGSRRRPRPQTALARTRAGPNEGQKQCGGGSKPMGSHFGVDAPPIFRTYLVGIGIC